MHFKTLLVAASAIATVSAQGTSMNLSSLIASNSNLTGLATLLSSYPDITSQLANQTNITLFAPSNQALNALNTSGLLSSGGSSGTNMTNVVNALLSYHVLTGEFYAANITSTPQFPHTSLNSTTYSNVTGGQVVECRLVDNTTVEIVSGLKSIANVTQADLAFTGGVVHVIDSILSIPGSFSTVAEAANLTAALGAINATNLTSTVDSASDITIFAPSNSAFQNIGSANLTAQQLAGVVQYHVLNGTVAYSSSLVNGSQVPTLGGGNLTITILNGTVYVNSARVVNSDILISGGVMHVIDSVLNPNGTTNSSTPNASETAAATAFSGASSASTVPFTSGVPTPTSSVAALVSTVTNVASGYSSVVPAGGASASGGSSGGSSSSSKGAAALPTGAMGAAALFGGAAFLANW